MALRSLARPVENIDDRDEARALALIGHLEPMVKVWRDGQDLRIAQEQVVHNLSSRRAELEHAQGDVRNFAAGQKSASERATPYMAGTLLAGAVALIVLVATHGALRLLALMPLVGAGMGGYLWRQAQGQVDALTRSKVAAEKTAADLHAEIQALELRTTTIEEEFSRRTEGFPDVVLADLRFPLEVRDIAGHSLLIDRSGLHPSVPLRAVDVSALQSGAADIADKLQAIAEVPPMLSASSASVSTDPLERLYGEENELSDLVTDFTLNLGRLRDVAIALPVVPPQSALSTRLASGEIRTPDPQAALTVDGDPPADKVIAEFIAEVARSREQGRQVFDDLQAAHDRLSASCQLYAQARSQSINALHASWFDVLQRATWCNR